MPDNTCKDCEDSRVGLWHGFTAACRSCTARAVARSPQFYTASRKGSIDRPYRILLDTFGLTHDEVKGAAAADMIGSMEIK